MNGLHTKNIMCCKLHSFLNPYVIHWKAKCTNEYETGLVLIALPLGIWTRRTLLRCKIAQKSNYVTEVILEDRQT